MGRFYKGEHYSHKSNLGPNERFGVESDDEFQNLARQLKRKRKIKTNDKNNTYINSYGIKPYDNYYRLFIQYNLDSFKAEGKVLQDYKHLLQKFNSKGVLLKELELTPYIKPDEEIQTFSFKTDNAAEFMVYKINNVECFKLTLY